MSFSRRGLFTALALSAGMLPGSAQAETSRPKAAAPEIWVRSELYFGTNRPNGEVSETEFRNFVDNHVTRLFPDGLTLLNGYGQFRNSNGLLIREKSYLLILLYPMHLRDAGQSIERLREIYKDTFEQESVLRVDSVAAVSF